MGSNGIEFKSLCDQGGLFSLIPVWKVGRCCAVEGRWQILIFDFIVSCKDTQKARHKSVLQLRELHQQLNFFNVSKLPLAYDRKKPRWAPQTSTL